MGVSYIKGYLYVWIPTVKRATYGWEQKIRGINSAADENFFADGRVQLFQAEPHIVFAPDLPFEHFDIYFSLTSQRDRFCRTIEYPKSKLLFLRGYRGA